MKKIVLLGNSPVSAKIGEMIRRKDETSQIILLTLDGFYPYQRGLFFDFLKKEIRENKIFYRPPEFYTQNRIDVILDTKVTKVNFKKKRISTEHKNHMDYDVLVITDTPDAKFPPIKGVNKSGVYALRQLSDVKKIGEALNLTDTVVIEANSPAGFQTAAALKKHNKEIFLVIPSASIHLDRMSAAGAPDPQISSMTAGMDEKNGIRVLSENTISEILGDGDVKAVRLQNGKVLAAQMVIFADTPADLKIFEDSDLTINQGICIDQTFKTNLQDVYAADHVISFKEEQLPLGETHFMAEVSCSGTSVDLLSLIRLEEQAKIIASQITLHEVGLNDALTSK